MYQKVMIWGFLSKFRESRLHCLCSCNEWWLLRYLLNV